MARSFNQVVLMGNLTRDPELRQIPSGQSVCSFSLALNRSYKSSDGDWQEATDYVDIVAWASLGERVAQYVTKGRPVLVSGRLQSRSWEKDGQKRSKLEVVALDVTFLGSRGGGDNSDSSNYSSSSSAPPKKEASNSDNDTDNKSASKPKKQDKDVNIEDVDDEPINLDDIPF